MRLGSSLSLARRRALRVRRALRRRSGGRPRLSVHRSHKNIYAQVIDDSAGRTLASASTLEKSLREGLSSSGDRSAASAIGKAIAERALAAGVSEVAFDRGSYMYHGRVKALADAARAAGLQF